MSNAELVEQIQEELNNMVKVPTIDIGMRAQQVELATSAEHIRQCLIQMVDNDLYLLERLKHSETERFKCTCSK